MKVYPIPMVPGPVSVPEQVLDAYDVDYGSGDLEKEYLELYIQTESLLQQILATNNTIVIQSGEGMLALWGALKSCIQPGERVLALATGVFGYGIGEMAQSIGADVRTIGLPYDQTLQDWDEIERAIVDFRPKMITVVHCETPSGTLNPLAPLGELKRKHQVPLIYADVVASLGGVPVMTDDWSIDLALGASQKALSAPPGVAFVAVSPAAWEVIDQVDYVGYDALKPFRNVKETAYFPYTPDWHGTAALCTAAERLTSEGLSAVFDRHESVARFCRAELQRLGLTVFPARGAISSPTVTAVKVPEGLEWNELDRRFRTQGLVVGGSYGPLSGKVFRLGHMGSQADMQLVQEALAEIRKVLEEG